MDINKGMFLDGYATGKPHGAWEYAKNVLLNDGFKSSRPEKGFDQLNSGISIGSYLDDAGIDISPGTAKVVGEEYVKDGILLFISAEYLAAAEDYGAIILKYNIADDAYEVILDENGDNFYFDPNYDVDSMHTYTPDGDLITAFCNGTDDACIEPMLMNVDKRNEYYLDVNQVKYLNLLFLFNRTEHIIEDYAVIDDGNLDPGVYYITVRFEYLDGTKSNWCMLTQPIKLGANPAIPSGSAIVIKGSYTGNFAYKAVDVAYVRKSEGQIYAYEYGNFNISNTLNAGVYTYKFDIAITDNTGTLVDLDSILVRKAFYRKSKSIVFTDNKIHLGAIKEENLFLNYQKFANDILVGYDTEVYKKDEGSGITFAPGEVYSLYTYFILKGSGIIALPFNIPGREDFFSQGGSDIDITSFASGGAGVINVFCGSAHGLTTGDYVDISDIIELYDGTYVVTVVNLLVFSISGTFTITTTGTAFRSTFRQFEDEHKGAFAIAPVIDTAFDYSDFPADKYIAVNMYSYYGTSEVITPVTTGILKDASFAENLSTAVNTALTAAGIPLSTTYTNPDTLNFSSPYMETNGLHFKYRVLEAVGGEDITDSYNDVISINNGYDHILQGGRPTGSFPYMSYWQNANNDGGDRHHRFPPLKTLIASYESDAALLPELITGKFGVDNAVKLGLKLENVVIPQDIADKASYIGFAYAKRSAENKMFYGDSLTFNYRGVASGNLHGTPLDELLKDGHNPYADTTPVATTQDNEYLYLDNFDILNNNLKSKITNIVPEYIVTYADLDFYTYRCTEAGFEFLRGTVLHGRGAITTSPTLTGYSGNMEVDYNCIIPNNIVFNPGVNFDHSKVQSAASADSRYRSRPEVASLSSLKSVDNTGGQKHIFALLGSSSYTCPISAANLDGITEANADLKDDSGADYEFHIGSSGDEEGLLRNGADISMALSSIYSMKDSVYIDPKSQVIVPIGKPIEITDSGSFSYELNDVGDCVISEKTTLFSSDPYRDVDTVIKGTTSTLSHTDARNQLENHASLSSLRLGNKIPFTHLSYGISDLSKIYRTDLNDPQSNLMLIGSRIDPRNHNIYKEPAIEYSNDYNALQDLDAPLFIRETPEYNLNKIIRGSNYKNEDLDMSALKTFLVDDYYMMPGVNKDIIILHEFNNNLIIQQRYGLHYAFIKDYLNVKGANAYLGTGELFSRRPTELRFGQKDVINCGHAMSTAMFKFGYVVFDNVAKRLYHFAGEQVAVLSNENAQNYFRDNYDFSNQVYNPLASNGNGVVLSYDGENDNLHIINISNGSANNNLSFSFLINNFLSFHEWMPKRVISYEDKVISFDDNGQLLKHNSKVNVCMFYDRVTPAKTVIDIIFTGGDQYKTVSKLFEGINWESQAIRISDGVNVYNTTFDEILLYNDDQCSGYVTLEETNWFNKNRRDIVKTWNFNEFRDLVVNNQVAFFNSDKEPTSNISSNKNWFNKSMFASKHLIVRLRTDNGIFNTTDQYVLILNNMDVNAKIARR